MTAAAAGPLPEISVVIATYGRETRLRFALEALAAQDLERGRFEVIVVGVAGEPLPSAAPAGLEISLLTAPEANISAQRNIGWRAARAPLVAFTDDDCRPRRPWLAELLAAAGGGAVLQGRTRPDPDEAHLAYGLARTISVPERDRWYQTCNIAYPRELLERLGGFDPALAFHCEDSDLGLRAEQLGVPLRFVPGAVVDHAVHVRSLRQAVRDAARLSGEPALIARFPAQRRKLILGVFTHHDHLALIVALTALPLWRHSRVLAVLVLLPYLRPRVKRRLRGGRPGPLALARLVADTVPEAIVDAVEIGYRLRSSARHRSLVL